MRASGRRPRQRRARCARSLTTTRRLFDRYETPGGQHILFKDSGVNTPPTPPAHRYVGSRGRKQAAAQMAARRLEYDGSGDEDRVFSVNWDQYDGAFAAERRAHRPPYLPTDHPACPPTTRRTPPTTARPPTAAHPPTHGTTYRLAFRSLPGVPGERK